MLVSINPLDADCTSPKWFETARDFYAKMILYGQIPYDEYFEKIRKTFCLQDFDPESFPSHVQRFHLYGESGRTKEMFPEVWAVGRDMNSHIFYMVQERSRLTEKKIPIFLFYNKDRHIGETRELKPFTSDESVFAAYLDYCRGINKVSMEKLDPDARDYLVSLDCLIHNLAELFREGVTIDLPDIR